MAATALKTKDKIDPKTGEVTAFKGGGAVTAKDSFDYGADAGAGFENQTSEDISVPFLVILQPGSPEVQGEDAKARPGMIVNKTTGDVMSGKEGVTFIPATTQHLLVEWIPRDSGGGLVGQHAIDSDLAKKVRESQPLGTYKHPDNSNELVETFYVYGLALDPAGNPYPAVVAFSSTHIKGYKDWMFRARSIVKALDDGRKITNMPLFAYAYSIRTQRQEKNGNTWFTPVVGFAGENADKSCLPANSDLYQAAKAVREAVTSGAARAATETLKGEHVDPAPRKGNVSEEKAPY